MGEPVNAETSDEYYRELLARVDDAIVETRGNYESENDFSVEQAWSYLFQCLSSIYQGLLVVIAVVAEACMTIFNSAKSMYEDYVSPSPAGPTNGYSSQSNSGGSNQYQL
mmetsp:Transcript_13837/g.15772  ORF Transcript_13837/g.15772 Transcript_13837/m.15772 type:complete len:110 (-) Transcript_13837:357-686(-)|eukprot:CAMPEP_0184021670 /NCGR_PEP_ID=MMETSP0954-20121128/10079_1 /TAXON_ID=627963 /ORGANISM="Aplanochytrium sp, Strain PBS07" /LENGTH=109 /DNA_ID=CAMNT_0026303759 /DNA_START=823 /DNA_END=1152 /DNA_ORIENTATION=-